MSTEINAVVKAVRERIIALEDRQRSTGQSGLSGERLNLQSQLAALLRVSERAYVNQNVVVSLPGGEPFLSKVFEVIDAQPYPLHVVIDPSNGLRHVVSFDMLRHAGGTI